MCVLWLCCLAKFNKNNELLRKKCGIGVPTAMWQAWQARWSGRYYKWACATHPNNTPQDLELSLLGQSSALSTDLASKIDLREGARGLHKAAHPAHCHAHGNAGFNNKAKRRA